MRLLLVTALLVGLLVPVCGLWAEGADDWYLAQCKVQLSERYGPNPDIKLISMRRGGNRLRLKVAVRLVTAADWLERSEFATCLVDRSDKPGSAQPNRLPSSVPR